MGLVGPPVKVVSLDNNNNNQATRPTPQNSKNSCQEKILISRYSKIISYSFRFEHLGIPPTNKGSESPGFPKVKRDLSYGWNSEMLVKKYEI